MRSSRSARSSIQNLDDPQSPKKTLVGMDSAQVGSTIKERFKFFAQQVAKVRGRVHSLCAQAKTPCGWA